MLQRNNSKSRAALGPGHWESKYIKPRGFFFYYYFFHKSHEVKLQSNHNSHFMVFSTQPWTVLPSDLVRRWSRMHVFTQEQIGATNACHHQCSHPLIQTFKVKTHSDTRNYLTKLQNFTMGTSTSQSVVTFYCKGQSGERKASIDRMSPAHAPVHISCIFAKQKPPYIYIKMTILKLPKGS